MSITSDPEMQELIRAARRGCEEAKSELLNRCRKPLLKKANKDLDMALKVKESPSDLVQDTLLEVYEDLERFPGETERDLWGWTSRILRNNLINLVRKYRHTGKRDLNLERTLSNVPLDDEVVSPVETPSEVLIQDEERAISKLAIAGLPEDYREVIRLRGEEGLSLEEASVRMGRSVDATKHLWYRAVRTLRDEMRRNG